MEATVARWMKQVGDRVEAGEALVELETDKANMEISAERAGVIQSIERQEGEDVKVGDALAVIDETAAGTAGAPRREASRATPSAEKPLAPEPGASDSASARAASDVSVKTEAAPPSAYAREQTGQPVPAARPRPEARPEERPAFEVERGPMSQPIQPAAARPEERVRMSRRRRLIAERLVEAQRTAAMLTTFNEADMSAVTEIRRRWQEEFGKRHGVRLGFTSFFVKAVIGALRAFPRLNAEVQGDEMVIKNYYDIGVAIGDPEGLVVPVLHHADRLSFAEIERAIKRFAEQAETGKLSLEDLRGGTFTVTNGGVFGSLMSTPILNPPQVAILGLHRIQERPVVINGQIVARPMMYLALSYDHRIVDGREAVQFLVRVKQFVEDPESLLFEG
jgi:2-oxoglutarate dehydrogenase E2 component (dihydrolipoamide succinyltransferase)